MSDGALVSLSLTEREETSCPPGEQRHDHGHDCQDSDTEETSNVLSAAARRVCGPMGKITDAIDEYERPMSPYASDRLHRHLYQESLANSGRPAASLDDLETRFLNLEVSDPNSGLLVRSRSEPCFRQLQHRTTHRPSHSSTSQDQPTGSTPRSTSHASSASSSAAASSGGTSSGSKRGRDDTGDRGKRRDENKRFAQDASPSRLACFYNKHDPLMYGAGAQAYRKFKACEGRFENMNRLQ
jgi:hypothetical protein